MKGAAQFDVGVEGCGLGRKSARRRWLENVPVLVASASILVATAGSIRLFLTSPLSVPWLAQRVLHIHTRFEARSAAVLSSSTPPLDATDRIQTVHPCPPLSL